MTTTLHLIRGSNARRHRLVAAHRISDNAPFDASNLRGEPHRPHETPVYHPDGTPVPSTKDYGWLPIQFVPQVDRSDYIIWSYWTVLAWRTPLPPDPSNPNTTHIWTVPRVTYSTKTSRHRSALLSVLSELSEPVLEPRLHPHPEGVSS